MRLIVSGQFKGVRSPPVLSVANLFHPVDGLAVEPFLNGNMRHGRGRRSTPCQCSSQGRRPCRSASANDASDASFRAFDCDAEVVALALDRVHLAVEFADPHDAVPEADVAVVEDEVAVW